jgi:hypothetical protein
MWCATGVNLSGGVTKDGGEIVGASVFYNDNNVEEPNNTLIELKSTVDESMEMQKLDEELKVLICIYLFFQFLFIKYIVLFFIGK